MINHMRYSAVVAGLLFAVLMPSLVFSSVEMSRPEYLTTIFASTSVFILFCAVYYWSGLVVAGKISIGVLSILWLASGMYGELGIILLLTNYVTISFTYFIFCVAFRKPRFKDE